MQLYLTVHVLNRISENRVSRLSSCISARLLMSFFKYSFILTTSYLAQGNHRPTDPDTRSEVSSHYIASIIATS